MRSQAVRAGWGTGKLEARPDQRLRRPLGAALHMAIRELGHPDPTPVLSTLKAFVERDAPSGTKAYDRWNAGITAPTATGRADSGDIEIDLVELLTDVAGLAADRNRGVAVFIDEMQDLGPDDVSALCAACHELGQQRLPLIVVGAGLPHLPAVLSASKSYSDGCSPTHASTVWTPRRRSARSRPRPPTRTPSSPPRRWPPCTR